MTTVYYYAAVEGRTWDKADLRFVPISAGTEAPFLAAAEENLSLGPVYLTTYRPEVAAKYRLMPSGDLWQVLPAWPRELQRRANRSEGAAGRRRWPTLTPGDVPRSKSSVGVWIGSGSSRVKRCFLTCICACLSLQPADGWGLHYCPGRAWERRPIVSQPTAGSTRPGGSPARSSSNGLNCRCLGMSLAALVPLQVGLWLVNEGRALGLGGGQEAIPLTEVEIEPASWRPSERRLERALGNLRGDILLRDARLNGRSVRSLSDPHAGSTVLRPGTRLRVVLEWESLRPIDENYKVFVQLLDASLQVRAQGDDKAPLGGSAPTLALVSSLAPWHAY